MKILKIWGKKSEKWDFQTNPDIKVTKSLYEIQKSHT